MGKSSLRVNRLTVTLVFQEETEGMYTKKVYRQVAGRQCFTTVFENVYSSYV